MNTWKGYLVGVLALGCAVSAHAAGIFRVDAASTAATPDGQSWPTAYKTLQAGVDAAYAASGGEVWVKAGTYTATTDPVVTMKAGVALYGGFAGTESARDQRNRSANVTSIDGQNAYVCVTGANNATLDGFTVTRGKTIAGVNGDGKGAGMRNVGVSPTVKNCMFSLNSAQAHVIGGCGGGMYNSDASPVVTNCTFSLNSAVPCGNAMGDVGAGGGMYNTGGAPVVTNCTFVQNTAGCGGGMYGIASSTVLTNCTFTGNLASVDSHGTGSGGGMRHSGGVPMIINCVFTGNAAQGGGKGGGMDIAGGTTPTVMNCTFTGNTAANGGAIALHSTIFSTSGLATVKDCILWGDTGGSGPEMCVDSYKVAVSYSCVQGGYTGTGNIITNPLFVSAPGNVRLLTGSPCIDTGTATGAPATDITGLARPQGKGVDMGAYEMPLSVVDPIPPVITTCAASQTVAADASCQALVPDFTAGVVAVDNYDTSLTITQSPAVGTAVGVGNTPVTLTVTDDAGNFATCMSALTVSSGLCGSFAVTAPNGGENWAQGETHNITWNVTGVTGLLAVLLNENGTDTQWLGAALASAGQFSWTIPASLTPGSVYRIHLISGDDNAIESLSANTFTIASSASSPGGTAFSVTSPNGGETWTRGEYHLITWDQTGVTGLVAVLLSDNGVDIDWLGAALASAGQFSWTIPAWVTPGNAYKIHLISGDNNALEDLSDNAFTIASGVSPLTVTSPNGGELWIQGETETVTWNQTRVTGAVAVMLNKDGTDISWLGAAAASAGQFSWTVPPWATPGSAYKIHLISGDNNAIEDLSDGAFSIIAPPLTLSSPNGGESWAQGETHSITWNQTDLTGAVAVLLNVDGADTAWLGAAATGQFSWTVPTSLTPGSNYKIHLIYGDENRFADLSDGTFTIAVPGGLPALVVTSPNGGETWTVGQSYSVTWSETNVTGAVAVLLNVDSLDKLWLGAAAASAERFSWTVPSWVTPASTCKIHLISGDNNAIEDLSDGTFTIAP